MPLRLAVFVGVLTTASSARAGDALAELVAAERAFAQTSVDTDMKTAFLKVLADDGVVYRPGPVNGREWFENAPPSPGTLSWFPAVAECSAAGDLGYTSGPWEARAGDGSGRVGHGTYFSVWQREKDGPWRLLVDIGVPHEPETPGTAAWKAGPAPQRWAAPAGEKLDPAKEAELLRKLEQVAAKAASEDGVKAAYETLLTEDARLLRFQHAPTRNRAAALVLIAQGKCTWTTDRAGVAQSGDVGYTSGAYEFKPDDRPDAPPPATGYYLRFWRRLPDGTWRVAVDLWQPAPPTVARPTD